MIYFFILLNAFCTFVNGYCFMKAYHNPTVYPKWYLYFTGFFTAWSFLFVLVNLARLA